MDRRILKTRKAIFDAFYKLIIKEDYSNISIQDIIDEADIGRSTFYDHFETKDDLLKEMCKNLFEHIFNPGLNKEAHCFIESSTIKDKTLHILYHLLEKKDVIKGILKGESSDIFIEYFRRYLNLMPENIDKKTIDVPMDFLKNHISGSFIEMIRYWVKTDFLLSPNELSEFYLKVLPSSISDY